jgi:hypothetical protein
MEDGGLMLRFTNFRTSNGPNVHVYLVGADDAKDSETVQAAGFIDLGPIKGNIGDQNYALGSDVDLSKYRAVSIWCQRFSVNFGAAPLRPDHSVSQNQTAKYVRTARSVLGSVGSPSPRLQLGAGTIDFRRLSHHVELQVSQPTNIQEHTLASAYNSKEHVLANRAPGNDARTFHVQTGFGKPPSCSAVLTFSLRSGYIHGKYFA